MSEQPKSLLFTSVLVKLQFALLVAAVFLIPRASSWYDGVSMQEPVVWPLCVCIYLTLIPAFTLVLCLGLVLRNVKIGAVFTVDTVKMLRVISYCCFAAAAVLPYWAFVGFWRCFCVLPQPSWACCWRCLSAKKMILRYRGELHAGNY